MTITIGRMFSTYQNVLSGGTHKPCLTSSAFAVASRTFVTLTGVPAILTQNQIKITQIVGSQNKGRMIKNLNAT